MRIGWVFGSYFLVSGGLVFAFIGSKLLTLPPDLGLIPFYCLCGIGALFGGMIAARASDGDTIIEPAIGSLLFVGSLIATFKYTTAGTFIGLVTTLKIDGDMTQFLAITGGCFFGGGLVGAFLGEKIGGDSRPGVFFRASQGFFSVLGGMFIGVFAVAIIFLQHAATNIKTSGDDRATMVLCGLAAGAFLGGLVARRGGAKTGPTALGSMLVALLFVTAFMNQPDGIEVGTLLGGGAIVSATVGAILGSIGLSEESAG